MHSQTFGQLFFLFNIKLNLFYTFYHIHCVFHIIYILMELIHKHNTATSPDNSVVWRCSEHSRRHFLKSIMQSTSHLITIKLKFMIEHLTLFTSHTYTSRHTRIHIKKHTAHYKCTHFHIWCLIFYITIGFSFYLIYFFYFYCEYIFGNGK